MIYKNPYNHFNNIITIMNNVETFNDPKYMYSVCYRIN